MHELVTADIPVWLTVIAWVSLGLAVGCASWIATDLGRRPQRMKVMNVVWPIVALFGSVIWLRLYRRYGRAPEREAAKEGCASSDRERPAWAPVAISASHCGAGCALGDLIAETAVLVFPALALAVGWRHLYEQRMFAEWIWALIAAYVIGVGFQYWAIAPMRDESRWRALWDAVKADTASILAWQVGMYGAMAIIQFAVIRPWLGGTLRADTAVFWFAMQMAMLAGFACAFPANALLIRAGLKEAM